MRSRRNIDRMRFGQVDMRFMKGIGLLKYRNAEKVARYVSRKTLFRIPIHF